MQKKKKKNNHDFFLSSAILSIGLLSFFKSLFRHSICLAHSTFHSRLGYVIKTNDYVNQCQLFIFPLSHSHYPCCDLWEEKQAEKKFFGSHRAVKNSCEFHIFETIKKR